MPGRRNSTCRGRERNGSFLHGFPYNSGAGEPPFSMTFCPWSPPSSPQPFSGPRATGPTLRQEGGSDETTNKPSVAPSLLPAAFPGFAVWDSKLILLERAGSDRLYWRPCCPLSQATSCCTLGRLWALGSSSTRHLPVAPSWQSLASGALPPWAAASRWAPWPSLKESSGGEAQSMAGSLASPAGCPRVAGAWVGQEASLRQCGCRTLPKRSNQHKCHCHHWEGPGALAWLHDLQRGTGTPWALVWLVLWGSVKPGPQFSETERGVQAWRHPVGSGGRIIPSPLPCPKSSPRIPLPLRTGLWEGGGDTDPAPALAGVHFPLQLG